jgi:hypothetical protein
LGIGIGWHGNVIVGNTSVTTGWLIVVVVDAGGGDEGRVATVVVVVGAPDVVALCDFFLSLPHAESASATRQQHATTLRNCIRRDSRSLDTVNCVTTTIGSQYCDKGASVG